MMTARHILVLAPHTDDGELGCGATIAKYIEQQAQVSYVAFSSCAESLPAHLPADTLSRECTTATRSLGITNLRLFDFPVRHMPAQRQEILEEMVRLNQELRPDLVFIPARYDTHQDHQVIHTEGLRAFKYCSILGYDLPWNNHTFSPVLFEKLEEPHLQAKQKALEHYHSQKHRPYMDPSFIRALAVVRGVQCQAPLAEGFEVYRLMG